MAQVGKHHISRLHFITQESAGFDHLDWTSIACEAGCPWIQLRMKGTEKPDILSAAKKARVLCEAYGATLIINDHLRS